jgi:membrane protein YdbS with pleckstrin-like domain
MDPELDWLTLDDDEEVVWSDTPHPASIASSLAVGVPLSLVLVGIPIVASAYLWLKNTHYVVTTTGLYRKSGILSRDVQKVGFDKVQNTSYSQGVLGSYLGYGDVDVSTAGGSGVELRFSSVEDPRSVAELVNRNVRQSGARSDDASEKAAVLDDVVDELRAIRRLLESESDRDGRPSRLAADTADGAERDVVDGGSRAVDTDTESPTDGSDSTATPFEFVDDDRPDGSDSTPDASER